jgi:phosphonate metabolism-associated iron-containing alcohol dehydrogenase
MPRTGCVRGFSRVHVTKEREAIVTFSYYNPVASVLGSGVIDQLPRLLKGRKAFLVTFPEARGLGLLDRVIAVLGNQLVGIEERVQPNPDVAELADTYAQFWRKYSDCEVIIALGGGSAIDTAKALMVGTQSDAFDDLLALLSTGKSFVPHKTKRLIAVPTTAGTGSEVTPWATIWDRVRGKKYSLHLDETWPEAAVIDADLMLTLPASVTIQSGLDALSHALESIWNRNANPLSRAFAVSAAREVIETLPALLKEMQSRALRLSMASAALKAGMAFSNTKTALAHSISYEMTLKHGLPHGIACSFTLPMVMRRAIGIDTDCDRALSDIFGHNLSAAPGKLETFLRSVGVQTEFSDYGVSEDESSRMVLTALDGVRGKNFIGAMA